MKYFMHKRCICQFMKQIYFWKFMQKEVKFIAFLIFWRTLGVWTNFAEQKRNIFYGIRFPTFIYLIKLIPWMCIARGSDPTHRTASLAGQNLLRLELLKGRFFRGNRVRRILKEEILEEEGQIKLLSIPYSILWCSCSFSLKSNIESHKYDS